jgi:hypothetical protein
MIVYILLISQFLRATSRYWPSNLVAPWIKVEVIQDTITGDYTFNYTIGNKDTFIPDVRWVGYLDTICAKQAQKPIDSCWKFVKTVYNNRNGIQSIFGIRTYYKCDSSDISEINIHPTWETSFFTNKWITFTTRGETTDIFPGDSIKDMIKIKGKFLPGIIKFEFDGITLTPETSFVFTGVGRMEWQPENVPGSYLVKDSTLDTTTFYITYAIGPVPKPELTYPLIEPPPLPALEPEPPFKFPPKNWEKSKNMVIKKEELLSMLSRIIKEITLSHKIKYISTELKDKLIKYLDEIKNNVQKNQNQRAFQRLYQDLWGYIMDNYSQGIGKDKPFKKIEGFLHIAHNTLFMFYFFPR